MKKGLAVIFPGMGYHKEKPLLYYSSKLVKSLGYELIYVEYHDLPRKVQGDAAMMKKAGEMAYEQVKEQLKDLDFDSYDDVVFIGKSIGTCVMAAFAKEQGIDATQIWYTPVEATLAYPSAKVIAFIGESDPWSDVPSLIKNAKAAGIDIYSYPDCNHSLECGDVIRDTSYIHEVMKLTEEFITG